MNPHKKTAEYRAERYEVRLNSTRKSNRKYRQENHALIAQKRNVRKLEAMMSSASIPYLSGVKRLSPEELVEFKNSWLSWLSQLDPESTQPPRVAAINEFLGIEEEAEEAEEAEQ